ncbi:hypothetical protein, partial [Mycobacterium sp.]|uniref:hypothetical protein n=1 Tax=Mycobacterium sp. TaxID=1785 RepID=UPI003F95DDA1
MVRELLGIATGAESEAVKLAAIRDALDRAGISAKQAPELSTPAVLVQDQLDIPLGMARERADSLITLMRSPGSPVDRRIAVRQICVAAPPFRS